MGSILIVAEIQNGQLREATYELASFAQKLASASGRDVKSLVMGQGIAGQAEQLSKRGGGTVYAAESALLQNYSAETAAAAIRAAITAGGADVVLISNTPSGWDVAPRIAAALDAGFVTDCFAIDFADGSLTFKRRVFNGKLNALISTSADKVVATVQPGATAPFSGSTTGSVEKLDVRLDAGALKSKFVEIKKSDSKGVDLSKADIIVSGGRGVGDPAKFPEVIQPLATALGGAMGASRPVVDAGWLPHEYQVGSSGQVVSPKLYIACGISGAIQHKVGMQGAGTIIAINKDPNAPIFDFCDVGVVGDLHQIVPKLTELVRASRG
ncbi:MAG: electron transfer flavoprotein subunit alpha/FixB family protein, partial [Myxococcota bacterium]